MEVDIAQRVAVLSFWWFLQLLLSLPKASYSKYKAALKKKILPQHSPPVARHFHGNPIHQLFWRFKEHGTEAGAQSYSAVMKE